MRTVTCPRDGCDLHEVLEFALTYDGYHRLASCPAELHRFIEPVLTSVRDRGEPGAHAGVELLRAALFYLQRQTHHWGHVPPADERDMRILLAAIRQACSDERLVDDRAP